MATSKRSNTKALFKSTVLTKDQLEAYIEDGFSDVQIRKIEDRAKVKTDARLQRYLASDGIGNGTHFSEKEIRLVLLGMTGSGKSATGSLLMGREDYFKQSISSTSVTGTIELGETMVNGIQMRIMDTPGFCDTSMDEHAICTEIAKVIEIFSSGVHGFLFVLSLGNPRFTDDQKKVFEASKKLFGPQFLRNCFFILTHGEMLEEHTLDEYLMMERGKPLSDLLVGLLNKRVTVVDNSERTQYGRERLREQTFNRICTRITGVYQGKAFVEAKDEKENAMEKAMKKAVGIIAKLTDALEKQLKREGSAEGRRNAEDRSPYRRPGVSSPRRPRHRAIQPRVSKQEEFERYQQNFHDAIEEMNKAILSVLRSLDQKQLKGMDATADEQLCKKITTGVGQKYGVHAEDLREFFMDELNRVRDRLIEPSPSVLDFTKGLIIPGVRTVKKGVDFVVGGVKGAFSAIKSLF